MVIAFNISSYFRFVVIADTGAAHWFLETLIDADCVRERSKLN